MHDYRGKNDEIDNFDFYLDDNKKKNDINIVDNSGSKIYRDINNEEIIEEIIIENDEKNEKFGKKK